jgi:hypothetical protein
VPGPTPGHYLKADWYIFPANQAPLWGLNSSHFHILMWPNTTPYSRQVDFARLTIRPPNTTNVQKKAVKQMGGYHPRAKKKDGFLDSANSTEFAPIFQRWAAVNPANPVFGAAWNSTAYETTWVNMLAVLKEELTNVLWEDWDLSGPTK